MKSSSVKQFLQSKLFTLLVIIVILCVLFTIVTEGNFLKMANIRSILNSMVLVSFLAIAEALLIISGCMDLSLGAVGTLCGCVCALLITDSGMPWFVGLLGAAAVGAICGACNATMINIFNFQPFIATLATASIVEGIAYVITDGVRVVLENPVTSFIGTARIGGVVPFGVVIAAVFFVVYGIILAKTVFGRKIYICGSNKLAARLVGINAKVVSYILFINAGVLAAIAGFIYSSRLKNATVTGITGQQFSGVTAAILGGVSFGGGSGGMLGCFFGLLVLNIFNNGMTCIGVNTYVQTIFSGALLIFALTLDTINQRRTAKGIAKAAKQEQNGDNNRAAS